MKIKETVPPQEEEFYIGYIDEFFKKNLQKINSAEKCSIEFTNITNEVEFVKGLIKFILLNSMMPTKVSDALKKTKTISINDILEIYTPYNIFYIRSKYEKFNKLFEEILNYCIDSESKICFIGSFDKFITQDSDYLRFVNIPLENIRKYIKKIYEKYLKEDNDDIATEVLDILKNKEKMNFLTEEQLVSGDLPLEIIAFDIEEDANILYQNKESLYFPIKNILYTSFENYNNVIMSKSNKVIQEINPTELLKIDLDKLKNLEVFGFSNIKKSPSQLSILNKYKNSNDEHMKKVIEALAEDDAEFNKFEDIIDDLFQNNKFTEAINNLIYSNSIKKIAILNKKDLFITEATFNSIPQNKELEEILIKLKNKFENFYIIKDKSIFDINKINFKENNIIPHFFKGSISITNSDEIIDLNKPIYILPKEDSFNKFSLTLHFLKNFTSFLMKGNIKSLFNICD